MAGPDATPHRTGWVVAAGAGAVIAGTIALGGIWAVVETSRTGAGPAWEVFTGAGAGLLFWAWIVAGCWRRATEPEPGPYDPAPVPHGAAFVVANLVLAVLFTALVAGGLWAGVDAARDAERVDLVRHRVEVAARAVDLDRAAIRRASAAGIDGVATLLPVTGASVVAVATDGDTASVLFRPDGGPPCVVLDIDADDLRSTRRTSRCS